MCKENSAALIESSKEIIERLKRRAEEILCPGGEMNYDSFMLSEAASIIEEMEDALISAEDENARQFDALMTALALIPHWISVEERLPENEDTQYLVASDAFMAKEFRVTISWFTKSLQSVDEYDFCGEDRPGWYVYDNEFGYCEKEGVRYWTPLLKPPKEDSHD